LQFEININITSLIVVRYKTILLCIRHEKLLICCEMRRQSSDHLSGHRIFAWLQYLSGDTS